MRSLRTGLFLSTGGPLPHHLIAAVFLALGLFCTVECCPAGTYKASHASSCHHGRSGTSGSAQCCTCPRDQYNRTHWSPVGSTRAKDCMNEDPMFYGFYFVSAWLAASCVFCGCIVSCCKGAGNGLRGRKVEVVFALTVGFKTFYV